MKVVAEFAMRGQPQALMASVLGMALPGFSWLGAAVVGLIILRRGGQAGSVILIGALVPATGWIVAAGEPVPMILLLGTAVLAGVLRVTVSWSWTLMAAMVISLPTVWLFELTSKGVIDQFVLALVELSEKAGAQLLNFGEEPIWLERILIGLITAGQLCVMLGTLALARWWQSLLYNPGGFGQEFRHIRLTPAMTLTLVVAMIVCWVANSPWLSSWLVILAVPFIFYGIALAHWYVASRKMGNSWLVVFYILLLFFPQYLTPLLVVFAILDGLVDLRTKRVSKD